MQSLPKNKSKNSSETTSLKKQLEDVKRQLLKIEELIALSLDNNQFNIDSLIQESDSLTKEIQSLTEQIKNIELNDTPPNNKLTKKELLFKLMGCTVSVPLLQYPLFPNAE